MNLNYFNQAYYQNVPSSEVNWAELAQRWIMARPSAPTLNNQNVSNFVFPPVPPPIEIRPPLVLPSFSSGPQIAVNSIPAPSRFFGNGSAPLPPPYLSSSCFSTTNTFQQNTDNEEYKAHYDASLEQEDDQTSTNNSAPDGAMSHWFSGFESSAGSPSVGPSPEWMWNNVALIGTSHFTPIIDNQMRKRLPAWILEGLEKAEKEKQKKQKKEDEKKKQEEVEKLKEEKRKAKGRGKFDSDSESECEETAVNENNEKKNKNLEIDPTFLLKKNKTLSFKDDEPEEDNIEMSIEERKQEALLAIKKLMTLVLLEATNNEIYNIAKECLLNAKRKARPKLLASSAALTALSAFGNDDEEENDETCSYDSDSNAKTNNLSKKNLNCVNNEKKELLTRKTDKSFNRGNLTTLLRPPTPETTASTSSTFLEKKNSSSESRHNSSTSSSLNRHHSSSSSRHSSKSSHFSNSSKHRSTNSSSRNSSSRHRKNSHRSRSPLSRKSPKRHLGNFSPFSSRNHSSTSSSKKRKS